MSQHKHRHRKSFLSSAGYYILVVILIVCLAMMVKVNRSKRAERDDYKATLSQQTVEDLGNITITKPTDAPEDAVVRNTEDNAGEDGSEEGSDQTPAEDKTE